MISKSDISHLEDLARIETAARETESLERDLSNILAYVDALKQADVSGGTETTYAMDTKNIFRKDEVAAKDEDAAPMLIEAFPQKEGPLLKVKNVL